MRVNGSHLNRITISGIFSSAILLLLVSCGGDPAGSGFSSGEGSSFSLSCSSPFAAPGCTPSRGSIGVLPTCNDDEPGVVDACGVTITTPIDLHDPITISVSGLTANTRHAISIVDADIAPLVITPAGGLIAVSDSAGAINKAVIVQNMPTSAFLGSYTVTVSEIGGDGTTDQTLSYTLADLSRVQCVDSAGVAKASFLGTENVFAKVDTNSGSLTDGTYDVYVLSDIQKPLANGGLISGTPNTVTVTTGTGIIDLGAASTYSIGGYDVVVDVNGNGIFNQGSDLISRHNRLVPCFSVQGASGTAVQQIASDKNGNKREIFDSNANVAAIRDIQAFVTPTERSAMTTPGAVDTYLVAHQSTWTAGDPLVDVTGAAKRSPVQNDSNSEAPWVLLPFSNLASLGTMVCYDVVVDTNQNGTFEPGTDFVDNVDHLGNSACGVRISTASCSNVSFNGVGTTAEGASSTLNDGDTTTDTAINISGTVMGSPGAAYLTITAGEQSNTITLTVAGDGTFSLNVPLFAGDNHITVSGVYADNSSCSQTITITSLTDLALFRAQLTWDGSTDMDLHLVRPGGAYSNGGGGAGDCNYSNCNVGLDGAGSNSISWGTGEEEDDPKLDVDCISCGNGIENIWMNQITEDGQYKVYVDAFSGSETDVTVTISILGTAVGQVNCGSMDSGSATDSCFVGTITWSGGTGGIGSFTPSGTLAGDF